jgi:hypothetical protein
MTGGGKRGGAGRPATPPEEKKITYSTKLRPDQIAWLKGKYKAAAILERLIDEEIKRTGGNN